MHVRHLSRRGFLCFVIACRPTLSPRRGMLLCLSQMFWNLCGSWTLEQSFFFMFARPLYRMEIIQQPTCMMISWRNYKISACHGDMACCLRRNVKPVGGDVPSGVLKRGGTTEVAIIQFCPVGFLINLVLLATSVISVCFIHRLSVWVHLLKEDSWILFHC